MAQFYALMRIVYEEIMLQHKRDVMCVKLQIKLAVIVSCDNRLVQL